MRNFLLFDFVYNINSMSCFIILYPQTIVDPKKISAHIAIFRDQNT